MSLASLPTLLLIPPLNCLTAACAGAALLHYRTGRLLLRAGLAALILLSLPIVSSSLLISLEAGLPILPSPADPPKAIVILAGNADLVRTQAGPAYTVGWLTLERERAAALLAKATSLPILVSGGPVEPREATLSSLMAASLHQDFGLDPKWLEERSEDTWQNAEQSAAILRASGIGTVYVVTHAWHMRRALIAFRAAGLHAVAAPVPPDAPHRLVFESFIPRVPAWEQSYYALHEWIGCAWYALRA